MVMRGAESSTFFRDVDHCLDGNLLTAMRTVKDFTKTASADFFVHGDVLGAQQILLKNFCVLRFNARSLFIFFATSIRSRELSSQ